MNSADFDRIVCEFTNSVSGNINEVNITTRDVTRVFDTVTQTGVCYSVMIDTDKAVTFTKLYQNGAFLRSEICFCGLTPTIVLAHLALAKLISAV